MSEPAEPDAAPTAAPKRPRKAVVLAGAAVALLAAAGGGAWVVLGGDSEPAPAEAAPSAFILLDPIVVNLRSGDGRPRFLRVKLALEIAGEERREEVQARMPKILDAMLTVMRELTPDDVAGAAGLYRIKEELLTRAHVAIGPGAVRAVLVQEVVQQ